ncbi:MAG: carboxymuconolactone decarboxylase family protein [Candidatus Sulfotelmatobacter sp.]
MMRKTMGSIPSAIEKATAVDEGLLYEHLRSRGYAMPTEGALDEETRTLIYLASALAAGSKACIQAMANKAKMQGISPEKILETVRIVRFALATKIIGDAEPVFETLQK